MLKLMKISFERTQANMLLDQLLESETKIWLKQRNDLGHNDTLTDESLDTDTKSAIIKLEQDEEFQKAILNAQSITAYKKSLLEHERRLLESGELHNITHTGATSIWLEAPSSIPNSTHTNVYRPMGDTELLYLVQHKQLPDTQPYQAIIEGAVGRDYATKYLNGKKWTDTNPTTVVEFTTPIELIETLKRMQTKIEDGAISMGLGNKAGKGLPLFNASMKKGETTFRIVKVKRNIKKKR